MTIEQTVNIPASHRLTIDVPSEIPMGATRVIIQFPFHAGDKPVKDHRYWWNASDAEVDAEVERRLGRQPIDEEERKLFRVSVRTKGAWADNPWENCITDIRAMRDEWGHRDPWNPDPAKRHQD